MFEAILQKIEKWLRPGYLTPSIYPVYEKEDLNLEGCGFVLVNMGTADVYLDGYRAIPAGGSLPIGSTSEKSIIRLKYQLTFGATGTQEVLIHYLTFNEC